MRGIIKDSNFRISEGGKAHEHLVSHEFKPYFTKVRPGLNVPVDLRTNNLTAITKKFNLDGIGFGNWVTTADRVNYLFSLILGLLDLNKVVKFKSNIGLGLLGITFGARGSGRALAHFEPGTNIINITRYHDGGASKEVRFFATGGLGSLAHEYGHFLDAFAGGYLAKNESLYYCSGGRSIAKDRTGGTQNLRILMDDIIEKIIWKIPGKELSNYYKKLVKIIEDTEKGTYWFRRTELFARAFEVYVLHKLQKAGIVNHLLTKKKYVNPVYLTNSEMNSIAPLFNKFISEIRKKI